MRLITTLLLISSLTLTGCGLSTLGLFGGGGGPTVNSNAQIGKENKQAVVTYEEEESNNAGRDIIKTEVIKEVETDRVEKLTISNQNIPPWVILLLVLGWLLPTPTEMGRSLFFAIAFLFRRDGKNGNVAMDNVVQRSEPEYNRQHSPPLGGDRQERER